MSNFDINKLAIEDSADYHVTDADGELQYFDHPTDLDDKGNPVQVPVTIPVFGQGTKKAAKAQFKRDEARNARMIGTATGKTSKRNEDDDLKERAEFLAEITGDPVGFNYPGGNKELFMVRPLGHIADGVENFYNNRGNFKKRSAKISSGTSGTQPG